MAKPMSKSKIVATLAEKLSTKEKPVSKKHIVAFFGRIAGTGSEGMQRRRGQVCDSEYRPRGEGAPQGAHGPQSANRGSNQDQSQDGSALARVEGFQRRDFGLVSARRRRGKFSGGSLGRTLSPATVKQCPSVHFAAACLAIRSPRAFRDVRFPFQGVS